MTGAELRAFRRKLGWTQAKLAEMAGISQPKIAAYERSKESFLNARHGTVLKIQAVVYEELHRRGVKRLKADPNYESDLGCEIDDQEEFQ